MVDPILILNRYPTGNASSTPKDKLNIQKKALVKEKRDLGRTGHVTFFFT